MRLSRGVIAAALAVACALLVTACGDSEAEISVSTASEADAEIAEAIQAELDLYREPFDLSALPAEQQAQVGEAIDQFPQAAGSVEELVVDDGIAEAATGLEPSDGTATTARLICGAMIRGGADPGGDNRVLGAGDELLADCERADANYP